MANKKRAFITGILGQDGPYLAKFLLDKDYEVYGLVRRYTNPNFTNTDYLGLTNKIEFVSGDMTDEASLLQVVKNIRPDEIYNLAGQSYVGASWEQSKLTAEVNALGVLYLLNAMRQFAPTSKFYQASTSELFGNTHPDKPCDETTPFAPRSPYAISKLYAHWMAINFRESYGLYCANGILFNHESPIRGIEFVTRKISIGVAKIKLGLTDNIRLGNLDIKRDWGFAGDYVAAMWLILQQPEPDTFVIATGEPHSIRDWLEAAFACVNIKDWEKYIVIDPRFKRPADIFALWGNPAKARRQLGWRTEVGFKDLAKMMVEADIKRLEGKV